MAFHGRMLIIMPLSLVAAVVIILGAATITTAAAAQIALRNCQGRCGNLTIPYPFGLTKSCSMGSEFLIHCTADRIAYLHKKNSNIFVTNISVDLGEIQIQQYLASDCYDAWGNRTNNSPRWLTLAPPFTISGNKNKFMAVGCDTDATFIGYRDPKGKKSDNISSFITGCRSQCFDLDSVDESSCSGIGCCQTNIPDGLRQRSVILRSFANYILVHQFNPCSYAFIVQEGQFNFSGKSSFEQLKNRSLLPMILNWDIGEQSCEAAKQNKSHLFLCKKNSTCLNRTIGNSPPSGYICQCLPGYEGNPYHPDGCQDVDECKDSNTCGKSGKCQNTPGNYTCACGEGYMYTEDLKKCTESGTSNNTSLRVALGISVSFFVLLVMFFCLYCGMKRRQFEKQKLKYFEQNGGLFLRQKLASYDKSVEVATIFTEADLMKATNNYDENEKIGEGGYGVVYKGTVFADRKKVVAIKKSKVNAQISVTESHEFVNEVIVLSQINHKNVVRLLGCCLETQTPILVYEFIPFGTLHDHIHGNKYPRLSLKLRLKIATETAEALSYLHHYTGTPIVHRDVKSMNILLDKNYTAKVADFGASRLLPDQDQDQLSTLVQGTLGYLDPEFLQSHILTEKSDVYSFGVVLAELLTSQKALSNKKLEAERNLANAFVGAMKEGRLDEILDAEIVREGQNFEEVVEKVAELAKRCLRLRGEERPSMKKVAVELGVIMEIIGKQSDEEKTDFKRSQPASVVDVRGAGDDHSGSSGIINSAEYDHSMQNQDIQMVKPYGDGR